MICCTKCSKSAIFRAHICTNRVIHIMSFTSLAFFLFLAAVFLIYFLFPVKKYQWTVLLAASYFFYLYAGAKYVFYILFTTLVTWLTALWADRIGTKSKAVLKENKAVWDKAQRKEYKKSADRKMRGIAALALVVNFGLLFFLKYGSFLTSALDSLLNLPDFSALTLKFILPLGISFYTFQSMSYVVDVYRGDVQAEKNPAKLALFISFFPQILQGPISRYNQLAPQLYAPHKAEYKRFKYGFELMLWGFFKKLVIADRAAIAIGVVTASYSSFNGTVLTFVTLLYALQLYADFSAGIDISRAVAQMLGIDMIQNFRQPYFATTLTDYWNRWHISLGAWMKDYVFYPLALSETAANVTAKLQSTRFGATKAGDHIAKVLPGTVASLIIFLIVGIWHGAGWRYILYGLWNGGIIMLSLLLAPCFQWQNRVLHIKTDSFVHKLFTILRTFVLVCLGNITDLAPTGLATVNWVKQMFTDQNLWIAWKQIGDSLILRKIDYFLLFACTILLFFVGLFREKHPELPLREALDRRSVIFQWCVVFLCIAGIVFLGVYGPGFDASEFAYMQF